MIPRAITPTGSREYAPVSRVATGWRNRPARYSPAAARFAAVSRPWSGIRVCGRFLCQPLSTATADKKAGANFAPAMLAARSLLLVPDFGQPVLHLLAGGLPPPKPEDRTTAILARRIQCRVDLRKNIHNDCLLGGTTSCSMTAVIHLRFVLVHTQQLMIATILFRSNYLAA